MDTTTLITIFVSVAALAFSIYSGLRSHKREDQETVTSEREKATAAAASHARDMATINVKLDGISGDVRDIKDEIRSVRSDVQHLTERVVKVEASTKSAHHRLDTIEGKTSKEE